MKLNLFDLKYNYKDNMNSAMFSGQQHEHQQQQEEIALIDYMIHSQNHHLNSRFLEQIKNENMAQDNSRNQTETNYSNNYQSTNSHSGRISGQQYQNLGDPSYNPFNQTQHTNNPVYRNTLFEQIQNLPSYRPAPSQQPPASVLGHSQNSYIDPNDQLKDVMTGEYDEEQINKMIQEQDLILQNQKAFIQEQQQYLPQFLEVPPQRFPEALPQQLQPMAPLSTIPPLPVANKSDSHSEVPPIYHRLNLQEPQKIPPLNLPPTPSSGIKRSFSIFSYLENGDKKQKRDSSRKKQSHRTYVPLINIPRPAKKDQGKTTTLRVQAAPSKLDLNFTDYEQVDKIQSEREQIEVPYTHIQSKCEEMDDQIIILSKREESKKNYQPEINLEQAEPVPKLEEQQIVVSLIMETKGVITQQEEAPAPEEKKAAEEDQKVPPKKATAKEAKKQMVDGQVNLFAKISKIANNEVPVIAETKQEVQEVLKLEKIKKEEQKERAPPQIETKNETKKEAKKQLGNLFTNISKIESNKVLVEAEPERIEEPTKQEEEVIQPASAPAETEAPVQPRGEMKDQTQALEQRLSVTEFISEQVIDEPVIIERPLLIVPAKRLPDTLAPAKAVETKNLPVKSSITETNVQQQKEESTVAAPAEEAETKKEAKKQLGNLFANISKIAISEAIDEGNEQRANPIGTDRQEVHEPPAKNITQAQDQKAELEKTQARSPQEPIRIAEPIPSASAGTKAEVEKQMSNPFSNISKIARNEGAIAGEGKESEGQKTRTIPGAGDGEKKAAVKVQEALVQYNIEIEQILPTPTALPLHHATRNLHADLQNVLTAQHSIMEEYVIPVVKMKTPVIPLLNQAVVCEHTIIQPQAILPQTRPQNSLQNHSVIYSFEIEKQAIQPKQELIQNEDEHKAKSNEAQSSIMQQQPLARPNHHTTYTPINTAPQGRHQSEIAKLEAKINQQNLTMTDSINNGNETNNMSQFEQISFNLTQIQQQLTRKLEPTNREQEQQTIMLLDQQMQTVDQQQEAVQKGAKMFKAKMYSLKDGRMYTVVPRQESLSEEGIYLLQMVDKIYYWVGNQCSDHDKHFGMKFLNQINIIQHELLYPKNDEDAMNSFNHILAQNQSEPSQITALEPNFKFYLVEASNGGLSEITTRPLKTSMLDRQNSYILEQDYQIYIWIGKDSINKESAQLIGNTFIQRMNKSNQTQVDIVKQDDELNLWFQSFFEKDGNEVHKEEDAIQVEEQPNLEQKEEEMEVKNEDQAAQKSAVGAPLMAQPSIVYFPLFYPNVEPQKPQLHAESINQIEIVPKIQIPKEIHANQSDQILEQTPESKQFQLSPESKRTGHFTFRELELRATIENFNLPTHVRTKTQSAQSGKDTNQLKNLGLDDNYQTDAVNLLVDVQTFIDSQVNQVERTPNRLNKDQQEALLKIQQYKQALQNEYVELEHSTSQTQQSVFVESERNTYTESQDQNTDQLYISSNINEESYYRPGIISDMSLVMGSGVQLPPYQHMIMLPPVETLGEAPDASYVPALVGNDEQKLVTLAVTVDKHEDIIELQKTVAVFVKIIIESPTNDLEMQTKRSSIKITKIKKLNSFQSLKLGSQRSEMKSSRLNDMLQERVLSQKSETFKKVQFKKVFVQKASSKQLEEELEKKKEEEPLSCAYDGDELLIESEASADDYFKQYTQKYMQKQQTLAAHELDVPSPTHVKRLSNVSGMTSALLTDRSLKSCRVSGLSEPGSVHQQSVLQQSQEPAQDKPQVVSFQKPPIIPPLIQVKQIDKVQPQINSEKFWANGFSSYREREAYKQVACASQSKQSRRSQGEFIMKRSSTHKSSSRSLAQNAELQYIKTLNELNKLPIDSNFSQKSKFVSSHQTTTQLTKSDFSLQSYKSYQSLTSYKSDQCLLPPIQKKPPRDENKKFSTLLAEQKQYYRDKQKLENM